MGDIGITPSESEYDAFLKKVERTIYIDNLSPQVTEKVIKAAFGQSGEVGSIQFIPNLFELPNMTISALVEMETPKQAEGIISQMKNYPFMVMGMPWHVRSRPATAEMFEDRPRKPGRRILCRWVGPDEPEFEVAKEMMNLVRRHEAEASLLLEGGRKKLAKQQNETLEARFKKFGMLEGAFEDGTVENLASRYNVSVGDA